MLCYSHVRQVITESQYDIWCHELIHPICMMVTLRICVTWIHITLHVHMYRPQCVVFLDSDLSLVIRMSPSYYHWLSLTQFVSTSSYPSNNNSGMFMYPLSSTTNSDGILFLYSADTDTLTDIIWIDDHLVCDIDLSMIFQFHKTLYERNNLFQWHNWSLISKKDYKKQLCTVTLFNDLNVIDLWPWLT